MNLAIFLKCVLQGFIPSLGISKQFLHFSTFFYISSTKNRLKLNVPFPSTSEDVLIFYCQIKSYNVQGRKYLTVWMCTTKYNLYKNFKKKKDQIKV